MIRRTAPRHRFHRIGGLALLVALAPSLALTGLADGATLAKVTDTHDGLSFQLPKGWAQVSLKGNTIGQLFNAAKQASPKLKQTLSADLTPQAAKTIKVYATATSPSGGAYSNLNVIIESGQAPLAQIPGIARQGLTQIGATTITQKIAHYSFGAASLSRYTLPEDLGKSYGEQVYVVHADSVYIVTFTASSATAASQIEGQIMRTWRFTKPGSSTN